MHYEINCKSGVFLFFASVAFAFLGLCGLHRVIRLTSLRVFLIFITVQLVFRIWQDNTFRLL